MLHEFQNLDFLRAVAALARLLLVHAFEMGHKGASLNDGPASHGRALGRGFVFVINVDVSLRFGWKFEITVTHRASKQVTDFVEVADLRVTCHGETREFSVANVAADHLVRVDLTDVLHEFCGLDFGVAVVVGAGHGYGMGGDHVMLQAVIFLYNGVAALDRAFGTLVSGLTVLYVGRPVPDQNGLLAIIANALFVVVDQVLVFLEMLTFDHGCAALAGTGHEIRAI